MFDKNYLQKVTEASRIKTRTLANDQLKTKQSEHTQIVQKNAERKSKFLLKILPSKIEEIAKKGFSSCGIEVSTTDYNGDIYEKEDEKLLVSQLRFFGKILAEYFTQKNLDLSLGTELYDGDIVLSKLFLIVSWKKPGEVDKDTYPFVPTIGRLMPLIRLQDWKDNQCRISIDYPD